MTRGTSREPRRLRALAAQERDLLAVLAQPREREAEIGLDLLLPEIEGDQRPADEVGQPGAEHRVDDHQPDQEARESPRPCRG